MSLEKKCLSLDEKFGMLLQKAEKFCAEIFFQQVTKGPSEPSVTSESRSPKNIKYWLLESIGDPWNQLWQF